MTDLNKLSDRELSECFVREVLGREVDSENGSMRLPDEKTGGVTFESWQAIPPYATSADAVLPWLEKYEYVDISREHEAPESWTCALSHRRESRLFHATAPTLSRAIVISLIHAKRATMEGGK